MRTVKVDWQRSASTGFTIGRREPQSRRVAVPVEGALDVKQRRHEAVPPVPLSVVRLLRFPWRLATGIVAWRVLVARAAVSRSTTGIL